MEKKCNGLDLLLTELLNMINSLKNLFDNIKTDDYVLIAQQQKILDNLKNAYVYLEDYKFYDEE